MGGRSVDETDILTERGQSIGKQAGEMISHHKAKLL